VSESGLEPSQAEPGHVPGEPNPTHSNSNTRKDKALGFHHSLFMRPRRMLLPHKTTQNTSQCKQRWFLLATTAHFISPAATITRGLPKPIAMSQPSPSPAQCCSPLKTISRYNPPHPCLPRKKLMYKALRSFVLGCCADGKRWSSMEPPRKSEGLRSWL